MKKSWKFKSSGDHHFYASSVAEWKTGTDLEGLILFMKAGGFDFSLFYIPHHEKIEYEIREYKPIIGGAIQLGYYEKEQKA